MATSYYLLLLLLIAASASLPANCNLSKHHYRSSCPQALSIVQAGVKAAVKNETRTAASLLRLHFYDCFGCDGPLMLDDTASFIRFNVVDDIKANMEKKACPCVVSCADILAIAARDSVVDLGGPSWKVRLERRDSTTVSRTAANTSIRRPTSNLSALISSFSAQGLSLKHIVALTGLARRTTFRENIYNGWNIDISFTESLLQICPASGNDSALANIDLQTPTFLHSDQELFNGNSADSLVKGYADDISVFVKDFARATIKMGNISALTGSAGQIRINCRKVN
ncbi:peroxidase 52 [Citrus sinensis]|uniref:Peroxidase 52 n=1 Tax=Citrus sinensis TaxID=2711 RepID=A0ACB8L1Q4_CITSI|nr:peroxidase 52 [Citrus sinensis]